MRLVKVMKENIDEDTLEVLQARAQAQAQEGGEYICRERIPLLGQSTNRTEYYYCIS